MLDGRVCVDEDDELVRFKEFEKDVWFHPGVMQAFQLVSLEEAVVVAVDLR